MGSVKQVIASGKAAEAPVKSGSKKAVKDGSAHPHAGSDARVRKKNMRVSNQTITVKFLSPVLPHSDGSS